MSVQCFAFAITFGTKETKVLNILTQVLPELRTGQIKSRNRELKTELKTNSLQL